METMDTNRNGRDGSPEQCIATSVEQSKRLLALGVPAATADMTWTRYDEPVQDNDSPYWLMAGYSPLHEHDVPAWSLGRLFQIALPSWGEDFVANAVCLVECVFKEGWNLPGSPKGRMTDNQ